MKNLLDDKDLQIQQLEEKVEDLEARIRSFELEVDLP